LAQKERHEVCRFPETAFLHGVQLLEV